MWDAFLRGLLELYLYLAQVCVLCNGGGGGGDQGVMTGDSMLYFSILNVNQLSICSLYFYLLELIMKVMLAS